ncbi:MAG: DUF1573 domain-containing protein [Phycisphaerae bacterium]|nr:DUF1573 domain-containing protein [Phycisphaerae bacterium]
MRRKYFTLVYLVVGCALLWQSGCQEQAKIKTGPGGLEEPEKVGTADAGGPQPKITFETLVHDFGEVPPNSLNKGQIKFTNRGEGVLKISKVGKCCGVVATLAADKEEYAPGESGAVNVEWRSGSQPMVFARELVVHSNDKANPASTLKIQAKIVLSVTWEPKRLRLFLDEDNAGSQNLTISCLDGRPFSITSFKSTGDCITADFDPSVEATKFVLEPKVNAAKLHENLKGRITIGLTHPDGNAAIVLFDVLAKYTISPPLLILFYAEPGKPMVRKISVLNNYKKDFGIDSLSSKNGIVGVKILDKRKITDGYQLEVELTPPASEGNVRFLDEFYLTLEDGEKVPIKCNGYYNKTRPVSATQ